MKKILFLLAIVACVGAGCHSTDNGTNANNPSNTSNSSMQDQGRSAPSGGGTQGAQ